MMINRALAIGLCAVVVASCNGGSGSPDGGAGGSAGGTTGVGGSGGGVAGSGGGAGGGGRGGGNAGTGGGAAGVAGQGGAAGVGGRGGGAGGQGGGTCAFASTYTIIDGGGLVPELDTATLSPPNAFRYERQFFRQNDAGNISCTPAIPTCGDPARVDVSDVEAAIAHPDVQAALALTTRPIYGDRGIADGPSFNFTRADNRGFSAGIPCIAPSDSCTLTPAGVTALMQVVRTLVDQQLADATCAQLR